MSEDNDPRYRFPPIEALKNFPNWTSCIGEERELDDADLLLKPARNQSVIEGDVAVTAAIASMPGEETIDAALGARFALFEEVDSVILYRSSGVLILHVDDLDLGFPAALPIKLRSLLPCVDSGNHIEIEITEDGEFLTVPSATQVAPAERASRDADFRLADELFRNRDYYGVVGLLRKHAAVLPAVYKRKLEYALSKCDQHFL